MSDTRFCSFLPFTPYVVIYLIQFERGEALDNIMKDVKKVLQEDCDEGILKVLPKAVDTVRKKVS